MAACVLPRALPTIAAVLLPSPLTRFLGNKSYMERRRKYISHDGSSGTAGRLLIGGKTENFTPTKVRSGRVASLSKDEVELNVKICVEEQLLQDHEIMHIANLIRLDVPIATRLALERVSTRSEVIGCFELSLRLCNDDFIRKLNKEWRGRDIATDVLSMSQHINHPLIMDEIVISVETAARQAEERGHSLIHQIRTLMVHGLLQLLRFSDESSDEAQEAMENEEKVTLEGLGLKEKGRYQTTDDPYPNGTPHSVSKDEQITFIHRQKDGKRRGSPRFYKPKFSYIFCDMDGTLLNSKSRISSLTAAALKEASSRGVKVVIATGKTRLAVINIFKMANLAGKDGIVSEFSPGVFVQGLHVHGRHGRQIYRRNLDASICREALLYSLSHKIPIVGFSDNRCLTLFEHPLLDSLQTVYHEPKAEIIPSVEQLLSNFEMQKLIFLDSVEGVATSLRPHWEEETKGRAYVVQAVPDILEIVPLGTSKGNGVRILLDHLGVHPTEIMAIGDGENDVEMLDLASLGVALSNGSEKAKAVANVIGFSNDEDGVADAIFRYAL